MGGSKVTTTSSMTKQEFAAKITDICTKGRQKIASLGLNLSSAAGIAKDGQKVVDAETEQIAKFKQVVPPDEIKTQVDDFVSKAETSRDKLRDLVGAAKNGDATKVTQMATEVSSSGLAVQNAAKTFGATC
jgi:hypothetical protein